jgi:hypothetical protein
MADTWKTDRYVDGQMVDEWIGDDIDRQMMDR